jgi:hypothetical protein
MVVCPFTSWGRRVTKTRREFEQDYKHPSQKERISKGDSGMKRTISTAAAIFFLAASFAAGGTFDGLAVATGSGLSKPVYLQPGSVVKTEFKANIGTDFDARLDTALTPIAQAAAKSSSQPQAKQAIAAKERRTGTMAPPPAMSSGGKYSSRVVAANNDEESDLEADLEKDLVLTPPPAKAEEKADKASRPMTEKKSADRSLVTAPEKKAEPKKHVPTVKKMQPPDYGQIAASPKPIQKVRPVTRNWWSFPAGAHDNRPYPSDRTAAVCPPNAGYTRMDPRCALPSTTSQDGRWPRQPAGNYDPRAGMVNSPATGERIVRDGVTIKLAPAAAPAEGLRPDYYYDESSASDILSTAAEIIGMPFAFIGSLF